MKRRLIVMRHCKSSWDHPGVADHQRPLNGRGRRDAPAIGARLGALGWIPETVVSSDSQRTRQTWAGVNDGLGTDIEPDWERALYHAGTTDIVDIIQAQDADIAALMVLGHNPGFGEFASWLSGAYLEMTTGNAVLLEADTDDWSLDPSQWTLVEVLQPRDL